MLRIAFDLDETLGVPLINGSSLSGWQNRQGSCELLDHLQNFCQLLLWSVSPRLYVNKALAYGLNHWFKESYSWDEMPDRWKDVRQLHVDFLVDDSEYHRQEAKRFGMESAYIVVPSYGSPQDVADPLYWVHQIKMAITTRIY
ncbi:MAG: hypothetical protein HUU50_12085 [Candidatus Brocadiae bacterium]|nr:hypothetical protein [Candidatus Brocadiia bacterium]